MNSIGRTVVNPTWSSPRFVDRDRDDYRVFGQVARQRFLRPTIDAGQAIVPSINPPPRSRPISEPTPELIAGYVAQPTHLKLISPDLYEDWIVIKHCHSLAVVWQLQQLADQY